MKKTVAFLLSLFMVIGLFVSVIPVRDAEADSAYVSAEGKYGMPDSTGLKLVSEVEGYKQVTSNFTNGSSYIVAAISTLSGESGEWFALTGEKLTDEWTSGYGAGVHRQPVEVSGTEGSYVLTIPEDATFGEADLLWKASSSEASNYYHLYNAAHASYLYRYFSENYYYWLTTRTNSSTSAGGDNWAYSSTNHRLYMANATTWGLGFKTRDSIIRFSSGVDLNSSPACAVMATNRLETYIFKKDIVTGSVNSYVTLMQDGANKSQSVSYLTDISDGDTLTLSASVTNAPSEVTYAYRSSDPEIAAVDAETGVVTFTGKGGTVYFTVEATVTSEGVSYTLTDHALYSVSDNSSPLTSFVSYCVTNEGIYSMPDSIGVLAVSLEASTETLYGIEITRDDKVVSQTLTQYTDVADGFTVSHEGVLYDASATNFTWTSSNPEVATVDADGTLTFTGKSGMVILGVSYEYTLNGETYTVTDYIAYTFSTTSERVPFTDVENDLDNFPQFPDPGSVRIDKGVVDTSVYTDYGVAQVELSVAGIPKTQPVDVVLVIDISHSMSSTPASNSSTTKMTLSKNAATAFADTLLLTDGVANDNRLAIVTFCDYGTVAMEMTEASKLSSIKSTISGLTYASTDYGGTNYDEGMSEALDLLIEARSDGIGNNRRQCVVFLTDGAPGIYNRASVDLFNLWYTDSHFSEVVIDFDDYFFNDTTALSHQSSAGTLTYFKYKTNSALNVRHRTNTSSTTYAKNWFVFMEYLWNDWVQGALDASDWTSLTPSAMKIVPDALSPYLHDDNIYAAAIKGEATNAQIQEWGVPGTADAEIYSIGLDLSAGSYMINASNGTVDLTAAQCTELLRRIATSDDHQKDVADEDSLTQAFTEIATTLNAAASDSVVTDEMGPEFDLQINPFVVDEIDSQVETGVTPTVRVGYWTLDEITRERDSYTLLEEISFVTDLNGVLTEVNSSVSGACYDADANAFAGTYVAYDFETETFTYNLDIKEAQEATLTYWVYLTGAYEGTRGTGSYDTNTEATLSYTNYLGNPCIQTFPIPNLPWGNAQVSYNYYLVNENGVPINRNGDEVPFAERITVSATDTLTFPFNNTQQVYARRSVPSGYTLYAKDAYYTVMASTSGNDEAIIVDPTGTTYVISPSVTNTTNTTLTLSNYYATIVTFPVYLSESMDLNFNALGAQAHIIHKTEACDTAPLYTDGIRFAIEVKMDELKKALNVGEMFNFAIMVQPAYKLGGFESYFEYIPGIHDDSTRVMTCNVSSEGVVAPDNGSIVFCGNPNAVFATREVVDGRPRYTLDSSNMIEWTRAMENAATNDELIALLREAGLVIFEANEDNTGFRYVVKLMLDPSDSSHQTWCELAYRGFFLKLDASDDYIINLTHQRVNSARRIFDHYSYERFGVGTEDDLNGWSTYTPKLKTADANN